MPPKATVKSPRVVQRGVPDFDRLITDDYQAQISHVFILHGNIYDFVDNAGNDLPIRKVLASCYDDNIQKSLNPNAVSDNKEAGIQSVRRVSQKTRIMAFYNTSTGLDFPDPKSKTMWIETFKQVLGEDVIEDMGKTYFEPKSPEAAMKLLNDWFAISKKILTDNKIKLTQDQALQRELCLTLVFTDSDSLFPRGDIANLGCDRGAIVNIRNWAQDKAIGDRNRIILMTRHLSDIHESIRGELAVSHIVRKPNLQDRLEWLNNFETNIKNRVVKDGALTIGENTNVTGIDLACDFSIQEFALQSAGMNRRQIKDVILNSWRNQVPVDFPLVQERKKRALEDEYGGMIDIKEPSFGFELIGGHDHFKDFCQWKIIKPLRSGNKKLCARGALMTGPPGTGKTMAAWALAKEAGVNFIIVDFGKVFGGLVGETESNTRKLIEAIEAAAPCVVFGDELDSVFSSGRQSAGDSGTSARVFNSLMTWLSDPGRVGKVVFLAATNRPELLDAALIRAGRMDVKIPMLPPAKGDAKGRWAILKSQTHKHKIVLADDLIASKNNPQAGLGRLLYDPKRIWTGAEMEQLLQAAFDETIRAERKTDEKDDLRVFLSDWDAAFDNIIPNTDEVERMTNLALLYVDNLRYVPAEWREAARDKKNLREVCGLDK